MNLWKRKYSCGVCGKDVIADLETGQVTCGCCTSFVPRWVIIDAWHRKKWLKDYVQLTEAEINKLKVGE